jgi:hypothetical protein
MSVYDLDSLRRGLISIEDNIRALEEALDLEREKKINYEREIIAAEAILNLHRRGMNSDGGPN